MHDEVEDIKGEPTDLGIDTLGGTLVLYERFSKKIQAYQRDNSIQIKNLCNGEIDDKDVDVLIEFLKQFKSNIHAEK